MRTDHRYRLTGTLVGAGLGAAGAVAYQSSRLNKKGESLSWDNLNGWQVILWTIIGAFVGNQLGNVLYKFKAFYDDNPDFDPDSFLKTLLKSEAVKSDLKHFNLVNQYRQEVLDALTLLYQTKLADTPQEAGSFKSRTAIASDYDVDIIVPFKKRAFTSLDAMHDNVYKKLLKKLGDRAAVVKNKRTIGITFNVGEHEIHFDIAPGREIGNFRKDGKLNMFVSPDWTWQNGSSLKIDVPQQQRLTVNNPSAREVIRLLKIYSLRNGLNIPAVILSQLSVKALSSSKYGVSSSKEENILTAMRYIARRLSGNGIMDIGNSNNNLIDKMGSDDRFRASELMFSDLNKIEQNPNYLQEVFKE